MRRWKLGACVRVGGAKLDRGGERAAECRGPGIKDL